MGLLRIGLKDFVIVETLELEFAPGFSVLTGETGAGKSILIDALELALGARAETTLVREGGTRAEVYAEFEAGVQVNTWLQEQEMESSADTILLRRTVEASGKSKGWINGTPASAAQLRAVGALLVDIHGQHAWQALLQSGGPRTLVDQFGHIALTQLEKWWTHWQALQQQLEASQVQAHLNNEQVNRLKQQIAEVGQLAPRVGEWELLQDEHRRLASAQELIDAMQAALENTSEKDSSALRGVAKALNALRQHADIDRRLQPICQILEQAELGLLEASRDLSQALRHTEDDPDRLKEVDQRTSAWMGLAKRWHCPPEQMAQRLESWQAELRELQTQNDLLPLELEIARVKSLYTEEAMRISSIRAAAAHQLASHITALMQDLGMKGGRFEVSLSQASVPTSTGVDTVDFLIAGHSGSSLRPIGKVASGGELSRLALAVAVATSEVHPGLTLVFDEIDSGIGGTVAQTVGQMMQRLGERHQVLAVTHLAQVAAAADHHFTVTKVQHVHGVSSLVQQLSAQERVGEIARMLGGRAESSVSLAHAQELLTP